MSIDKEFYIDDSGEINIKQGISAGRYTVAEFHQWLQELDESLDIHKNTHKACSTELEAALAKAEELRLSHYYNDDDCWYSCPASGQCCRENAGLKCDCGADAHNARVDELIKLLVAASNIPCKALGY